MARAGTRPRLNVWLNETEMPIFLLDRERRVIFFNAACEALTGWSAEELSGVRCDYRSTSEPGNRGLLPGALAPPPEVYLGERCTVPTYLPQRTGERLSRLIEFFPLPGADGETERVLGLMAAISAPGAPSRVSPSQEVHAELAALKMQLRRQYALENLLGDCAGMRRVFRQIQIAAGSLSPLLLTGAAGTGKTRTAHTIHHLTPSTSKRPFVPFDCRITAPVDLIRALKRIREQLDISGSGFHVPGTVFFAHLEKLDRDVQERIVQLWDSADARLAASTATPAETLRDDGRLLPELYFLLTSLRIELPTLKERGGDLLLLAQHFIEERNADVDRQIGGLTDEVRDLFQRYNWPGNVAELKSVIKESCEVCVGTKIRVEDVPFRFRTGFQAQSVGPRMPIRLGPLDETLEDVEREQLQLALAAAGDNKSQAAELLKIPRARLYRRLEQLGLLQNEPSPSAKPSSPG